MLLELKMSYYLERDSHFSDKIKVVLDLPNYATKIELSDATGVDTSKLTAKRDFIALKAEDDWLDINKLVNVGTDLSDLKANVDDLDVDKLKTVPVDFKKLNNVASQKVVKKAVYNKLNTKVNNIENKIPGASISIHVNQYNADKQS